MDECNLYITEDDPTMVFEMKCKLGVKKTYRLNVEDTNPINAIYNREACPNRITSRPKLFEDCLNSFHNSLLSVTMSLSRRYIKFKSYVDSDSGNTNLLNRKLETELTLDTNDFDKYILQGENEIDLTFSLREMKALLAFCETANQPIQLYFSEIGQPIIAYTKMYNLFESDFVIATLKEGQDDEKTDESSQSSKASVSSQKSYSNFKTSDYVLTKNDSLSDRMETEVYKAMGGSNTLDGDAIWLNDLDKDLESKDLEDSDEVHSDEEVLFFQQK